MLEKIIKITPLTGALLVFCGVLKLIFYYSYFNVHIIDYLEFQEIITSFFGDINIIIIFGMTMLLISFLTLNFISKKTNLHFDDFVEKLYELLYPRRFRYSIAFFIAIIVLLLLTSFEVCKFNYFIIYLLTFCTIQMLTYLFITKENGGSIDISGFYGILILGITLTFSIYLFAKRDIQQTNSIPLETTLELEDGKIICNKETKNLYIGKTSKYVFVRIDSLNSTFAISTDKITKYKFK